VRGEEGIALNIGRFRIKASASITKCTHSSAP
jgi:hypothetical protein